MTNGTARTLCFHCRKLVPVRCRLKTLGALVEIEQSLSLSFIRDLFKSLPNYPKNYVIFMWQFTNESRKLRVLKISLCLEIGGRIVDLGDLCSTTQTKHK